MEEKLEKGFMNIVNRGVIMNYKNFQLEREKEIAILTINKPLMNVLSTDVLNELSQALDEFKMDRNLKVLIITGAGKAFVAGADIKEMKDMNPLEALKYCKLGQGVFNKIENLSKVVIAAVNGYALGGGMELALACDIRIASENAKFGSPEVNLGVLPGFGGTQRLPRLVGIGKAKELIFTGDIIDAKEALKIGLVNNVVKPEELLDSAKEIGNRIASKGFVAVILAKNAINRGRNMSLDSALSIEANVFSVCFSTKDQKEGMNAFIEKRKAKWKGE